MLHASLMRCRDKPLTFQADQPCTIYLRHALSASSRASSQPIAGHRRQADPISTSSRHRPGRHASFSAVYILHFEI